MILDAEDRQLLMPHSFNGVVIQINVRDLNTFWQRVRIDGKTVVLRGDGDFAAAQIFYRLVRAAVPEFQFESRSTERETEDLMAEANAENWCLSHQIFNDFVRVWESRRIARTV